MADFNSELRERLKFLVEHFGQSEVARRTDTPPSTLSRYLRNTRIPAEFLARATDALQLRPEWILLGEEPPFAAAMSEKSAAMAENLLEIVRGIEATSRMRAGAIFGQSDLRTLHELNEALQELKKLRSDLRAEFEDQFFSLADAASKALSRADMEGAERLIRSAEVFAELCPDEDILSLLHSSKSQFLTRTGNPEAAAQLHARLLNWSLANRGPEDDNTLSSAINHATLLTRLERRAEAQRLCEAFHVLASGLGENHPRTIFLRAFSGYLHVRMGNIDKGLGPFMAGMTRLRGTKLFGIYAAHHLSVLYLTGAGSIRQLLGLVGSSQGVSMRAITNPMAVEDLTNLEEALECVVGSEGAKLPPGLPVVQVAAAVAERLAGGAPAQFRKSVTDNDALLEAFEATVSPFQMLAVRAMFERLGGRKKNCQRLVKELSTAMEKGAPQLVPDVLTVAQHQRNLVLSSTHHASAECEAARRTLAQLFSAGYRCLGHWQADGLLETEEGGPEPAP